MNTDCVESIGELAVHVFVCSESGIAAVHELKGKLEVSEKDKWYVNYDSEDHLARILNRLRDAEFTFYGGQGWPPSAVIQMLREKGKMHGPFREVTWEGNRESVRIV